MEEPLFVSENAYTHEAYDYDALKKKGIEYVQRLTGGFWTDYNEHDPGVTILEQLVYAMTDLAYRTGLPIQDLLFDINPENKIFFNPAEILTVDPITLLDYRKAMIDELPEVKNIWLDVIGKDFTTLKGLYNIIVDAQESPKNETEAMLFKEKVRTIFGKYRTICEDIENVILQKPIQITINASIELNETAEPEQILAEMFFKINEFYNPEINFLSLQQAIDAGKNIDEIFSGPLLKHGIILDENLKDRHTQVLLSDISRIIMQIEGVSSVKNIALFADGIYFDGILPLQESQSVRFSLPTLTPEVEKNYPISFFKGNFPYKSVDYPKAIRRFNEISASNKRVYRTEEYNFDTSRGQYWNLAEYYSLQNQFPMIYGVSTEGVPLPADDARKAQAKQLKGYLILFEQILANYLSQVAHLKDLFSPKTRFRQTYFSQSLEKAIPNSKGIFKQELDENTEAELVAGKNDALVDYKTDLQALMRQQDNFEERRNKFLDFFLAVHGETYEAYQLSQKPFYKNAQDFAQYQLESKTKFLGALAQLNKQRATAMNYLGENLVLNYRSGLEEKLITLLNLTTHNPITALRLTGEASNLPVLVEDANDAHWLQNTNLLQASLSTELIEAHFDYIDENDLIASELVGKENTTLNLDILVGTPFVNTAQYSTYFMREGANLKNYLIGKVPNNEKYHVVFEEQDNYLFLGSFDSEEIALQAVAQIQKNLYKRNSNDEKLFLIENILLRPDVSEKKFGFFLLDEKSRPTLKSDARYTFQRRKQIIENLEAHLSQDNNYGVERKDNGNFEIQFSTEIDGEKILLRSIQDNVSVQKIHEIEEELFSFISNEKNIIPYQEKIAFYIQLTDFDEPIEEDFFHCQISCVLPNWTTRLHNPQFQSVAENIIKENIPSNVIAHLYWLSIQDMKRFEDLYSTWLEALQEIKYPKKIDENLRNELTRFLSTQYSFFWNSQSIVPLETPTTEPENQIEKE